MQNQQQENKEQQPQQNENADPIEFSLFPSNNMMVNPQVSIKDPQSNI